MSPINWISHRGFHQEHVENTKAAFDAALEAGFASLETDLRTTVDGHIVLHHDSSMERTAGRDICVEDMTLVQFKETQLVDGQFGMSLEEFLTEYAAYNWIFDIKPESAERSIQLLAAWASDRDAQHWLLAHARFLLWSAEHDRLLLTKFPGATTLARESECRRAGFSMLLGASFLSGVKPNRVYALPPSFCGIPLFKPKLVEKYRSRGGRVLAYLPERNVEVDMAIKAGVDEILTNGLPQHET
ncbi:glycerophosphodiester phosphodiesterase [Pseudobacteriovorax antillogorgiicola]|uniref:Glycerophosphoryl diester phosphodiesterase n=1 Tax=Pseudobacteriovorax antillogorgiicola TaxID=1513793 RepID=A0A1Y6B3G5_9BACT|nr:glycerophosphodiester phosphodiesterase family protein [Pseudobacteriovorax antillogorgiicola]TCS59306.1 glycerophosphoryl diester phosphodiesterase [Pseudobacteriovorax antillogorgiicola]SME89558.1 Glycerophosphoryl diester phosphodiesterase [Pseudobacteriovorax antillogorgiicola]